MIPDFKFLNQRPDFKRPNFIIGDYSYLSGNIYLSQNIDFFHVGKFCSIAEGLNLISFGHNSKFISTYPFNLIEGKASENFKVYKGYEIKNDVYIGMHTVLHGGIEIGDGAIIAAYSVLLPYTKVEPYSVYGGNPAKLIRYRFNEEDRKFLLNLKWWNFPIEEIKKIIPILLSSDINKLREIYKGENNV